MDMDAQERPTASNYIYVSSLIVSFCLVFGVHSFAISIYFISYIIFNLHIYIVLSGSS